MTLHKTATVDGLSVFYREAGEHTSPKLVLLGGFPSLIPPVPQPHPGAHGTVPYSSHPTTRASATPTCRT